jgi:hypothetical protein
LVSVVESELRFFEVKVEGVPRHTFELGEAVFGEAPEGLDSVDVVTAIGEFIFTMSNSEVLRVSDVDQAVIADPTVSMNDGIQADFSADNPLQGSLFGVWHDLSPDSVTAFEDSKYDGLTTCAATPFSFYSMGPEIRLVDFDSTVQERFSVTQFGHSLSKLEENGVHRPHADTGQAGGRTGRQILVETAENLTEFGFADFRRSVVLVNSFHHRSITPQERHFASYGPS